MKFGDTVGVKPICHSDRIVPFQWETVFLTVGFHDFFKSANQSIPIKTTQWF